MENNNTNWCQSVTGIVIKDNKVLLARHTYGSGKGKLIVPGGYVEHGETPQEAVKRSILRKPTSSWSPKISSASALTPRTGTLHSRRTTSAANLP